MSKKKKCPHCKTVLEQVYATEKTDKGETVSSEVFALYCPNCKWIGNPSEGA